MNIVHVETLISAGPIARSRTWSRIRRHLHQARPRDRLTFYEVAAPVRLNGLLLQTFNDLRAEVNLNFGRL